ncbi:MAG: PAS domain S-box protein [Acidobacteria bacterium]|nr:PAS domain S-box protein [Acidobacteriota bacterium]
MTSQPSTTRVTTRTLLLLFIALLALATGAFNLRDRLNQKIVLTDGVVWRDDQELGVVADHIEPGGPASKESIRRGDVLIGISPTGGSDDFEEVTKAQHVQIYLDLAKDRAKDDNSPSLSYWIEKRNDSGETVMREGVADLKLQARPTHLLRGLYLALVGLIYLAIGIYFLLRQGRAPHVTHFFLLCLLAFVVHFFSPTEEMRMQFDKAIDFADYLALILLAPMLVHFAAIYPSRPQPVSRQRWLLAALYAPSVVLIAAETWIRFATLRNLLPISAQNARNWMSKFELLLFAVSLLASAAMLIRTYRQTHNIVVRQQLKWVMWGMSIASALFASFYVPSFFTEPAVSASLELISLLPLSLIPLTFGYSIARFRLTDVDVVMRRSFAYIIATLSVAALFGTVMAVSYEFLRSQLSQEATLLIAAIAMSVLAMLFAPVKNWLQERIDRIFYGEKYDYRVTLQDFGRTLASTTELDPLLDSLMWRLKEVFTVERLAIFVEDKQESSGFRVARAEGLDRELALPAEFSSILRDRLGSSGIVRVESTDAEEQAATGRLITPVESLTRRMFSYFVPCGSRSRIVAVIALGRPTDGALLSSEDTDLLRAISGYVAVAIENALLLEEQATRAKELARLKEFNENIIESINVGVMVINLSGRITNWNGALEEIYGLRRDQTINRRITEVFDTEMLRALRELMARSEWQSVQPNSLTNGANGVPTTNGINGTNGSHKTNPFSNAAPGEPVTIYKFRARSADGRDLTLNLSLAPLQSKTSQIEGTLVAIEDVTERIRLEEQLQQSDKLSSIGLLAAGVAHEVNTPLTGISSYSQMLMQQIPDTDPRHQLLEKIHRQTSRASSIVNNLLNFSRVSDSRLVPVDLNRVLDDTIQLLEAQLRNTEIEVVRNYCPGLPSAPGNAAKLQQVFMNLILNARDAMPQGGRLEIATESDIDSILIRFRDTGLGIAPEHLAKIYDPFFTTKQIGKGTGLGLAVSYGIIRDHGGHITVESQLGEGALFQITLPMATTHQQFAAASD